MAWWAVGGAAAGLASVAFQWIVKPGVFGELAREEPVHVPGAPQPADPAPPPWSLVGWRAAAIGAVLGALGAWGWYGPEDTRHRIGLIFAILGVAQSLWQLVRLHDGAPAVGEPPPDDPEDTVQARLPRAWWGLVMAALGVVMAYF